MNYHFFIDEKFVNDFVADALQIDSYQVFIAISSRPLRFITNPAILYFKNHESELIPIVEKITDKDNVYVHWFTTPIMQLIEKLPLSTNVYLMFYGGDFFESGFPPGKNVVLDNFLFDPLTREYSQSNYLLNTKSYLRERLDKAIATGNRRNMFHTWLQNFQLKRRWLKGHLFEEEWEHRKRFLNRITAVCHWNHFDIKILEQLYAVKLNQRYFIYNVGLQNVEQKGQRIEKKTCTIWLGNSDTPTNNHLDALKALSHFKHEDIEIICPLNYGNKSYGDLIEKKGKHLFGEKFVALRDYLDRDTYYNLMDKTNVAVMFHNRGQAGGNVLAFLKKGVKVYMKDESSIYQYLNDLGLTLHRANEIRKENFNSFRKPESEADKLRNLEIMNSTIGDERKRLVALKSLLVNDK